MAVTEEDIRARCAALDLDGAMTGAVELYGDEIFGFLVGLAGDRTRAEDAFSATCERIWRGLPAFRWGSSFRLWAYRIARNEFLRTTRDINRSRNQVPLSEVPSVQRALHHVRTSTPFHERPEVLDKFAGARAQLDADDHMLLALRIQRQLPWEDIAKVLGDSDEPPGTRELAALRKRFERVKTKLRELVREA